MSSASLVFSWNVMLKYNVAMGIIDYLYMGIVGTFSLGCIIYGIRLAIKTRKENIKQYIKNKNQRKIKFENNGTKH